MVKMTEPISDKDVIIKEYSIRRTGKNNASYEVTIPKDALERALRKHEIKVNEAKAVWKYDSFEGILLIIKPKKMKTGKQREK